MSLVKENIQVMNLNLYCEHSITEKPPIILIHGYLSSTYTFHRVMPLLEKYFSIIAIDLPGFGRSEKSKKFRYSFENYAKLIREVLDYFNIQKAMLVGHSMGGQVSLNVAKFYPERVEKLVLLNSSGYLKRAKRLLILSSYLPFFHHYVHYHINKHDVKHELKKVLYDHSLITNEMMEEYKRPLVEKEFPHSLIRLLRHREGDLSSEDLKRIHTPALLIWGKQDEVVPYKVGQRLVDELPNAELVAFDHAGHLITEEKPNEVVNEILKFK